MRFARVVVLLAGVWMFSMISWLVGGALSEGASVFLIAVLGGVQAAGIAVVLLLAAWLRRRGLIHSVRFCLAGTYLILIAALLGIGFSGQAKEPLIWEGIGPMLVALFPMSQPILRTWSGSFSFSLFVTVLFGGLFYFLLGYMFERFIIVSGPTTQNRGRT